MLATTVKRTMATALGGAAIVGTIGAPTATAMPIDPIGAPGESGDTQIVVSPPRSSAPSADEATSDAGFDLSSAAIGAAAGTGVLIVVLTAGGLAWGGPPTRRHGTAGA